MKLAVQEMGGRGALLLGAIECREGGGAGLSSVMRLSADREAAAVWPGFWESDGDT